MMHQEIIFNPLLTSIIGLCIGSFLHALAHRIAFDKPVLLPRSHCPKCNTLITWYHNIPVLSWLMLQGQCYTCKNNISWIYPIIELVTAINSVLIWHYMPLQSPWSGACYSIFIAALIISTTTDLHTMTIPQIASLWIAPIGIAAAATSLLKISLLQSIIGSMIGYLSLWIINFIFKKMRGINGIGIGDMELFCMIGAFIGPLGLWHTLLIASIGGSITGGILRLINKEASLILPFGPFLALGACCHLFFGQTISWVLGI